MRSSEVTRYLHATYRVPEGAPDEVIVRCEWSKPGEDNWQPAKVMPLVSETALHVVSEDEWREWVEQGRITERRAAGVERTVILNPYPEAQVDGKVDVDFRIRIETPDGNQLDTRQLRLQADNSDAVYIEDWSQVLQRDELADGPKPEDRKWEG